MHTKYVFLMGLLVLAVHIAGCKQEAPAAVKEAKTEPAAAAQARGFSGKVLATTNAAGYTYIQVDTGTNQLWAAVPQADVKVGDTVVAAAAMPMQNYHSKTLNRDFDVVYFANGVSVNGARAAGSNVMAGLPKDHPPIAGASSPPKVDVSGVKKAEGGQTVAEIIVGKDKFSGQPIKVRGKVVKYNGGILGKNWMHIQDGSGSAGSNDLTVTTSTTAKLGDTVLVTGVLSLNKDFGSGYKYGLIVEDAQVAVEN